MRIRGLLLCVAAGCVGGVILPASPGAVGSPAPHSIRQDMGPINTLLLNHEKISFRITLIPRGVRTVTTSNDPHIVRVIQIHAQEMKDRMKRGDIIRPNDPIFQQLFKHHSEVMATLKDIPNGVVETETSHNPQVVLLIRAHTQAVAGFVREGMARARINTPLPPGYRP